MYDLFLPEKLPETQQPKPAYIYYLTVSGRDLSGPRAQGPTGAGQGWATFGDSPVKGFTSTLMHYEEDSVVCSGLLAGGRPQILATRTTL